MSEAHPLQLEEGAFFLGKTVQGVYDRDLFPALSRSPQGGVR